MPNSKLEALKLELAIKEGMQELLRGYGVELAADITSIEETIERIEARGNNG